MLVSTKFPLKSYFWPEVEDVLDNHWKLSL